MPRLLDLARAKIPNFAGIKYTSGDLEKIVPAVAGPSAIFIGSNMILAGAMGLGFQSFILSSLNVYPEFAQGIYAAMENGDLAKGQQLQRELNLKISEIVKRGNGHILNDFSGFSEN